MTYSSMPKLVAEIERDIRNQVVIDQMKRLGPAARFEIWFRRRSLHITLPRYLHADHQVPAMTLFLAIAALYLFAHIFYP